MGERMEPLKFKDFINEKSPRALGNYPKRCEPCGLDFPFVGVYEAHLTKVHNEKPMDHCDECNTSFKRRMGLILHFRQTHLPPDETYGRAIGCDICDALLVINGFSSYDDLVEHTKAVHGPEVFINTVGNAGRSNCPLCSGSFTYRKGMIEHLQVIHGDHLISHMLGIEGKDAEKMCTDRRFKCRHCHRLFTVRKSLISHLERIHDDYEGFAYGSSTVASKEEAINMRAPKSKIKIEGKKNPERKRSSISKYLDGFPTQNPGIHQCPKCPQVFPRKPLLDMHIKMCDKVPATDEDDDEDFEIELKRPKIDPIIELKVKEEIVEPDPEPDLVAESEVGSSEFYTSEEIAVCEAENHSSFYDETVACAANAPPDEELEPCQFDNCNKKFLNYYSMMRHLAFFHYPEKTASIMNLKVVKRTSGGKSKHIDKIKEEEMLIDHEMAD